MSYTIVQTVHNVGTTGTSCNATFASTKVGTTLVAIVTAAKNPGVVTFTAPTNWVQDGTTQDNNVFVEDNSAIYYYPNNPGAITAVSFTMSTTPSAWTCTLIEIAGIAPNSPTDGFLAANVGSTGRTTGNLTTVANGDLILGVAVIDAANAGAPTVTEASGYTNDVEYNDVAGWFTINVGYQVQTTAGAIAYAPTWTTVDDATLYVLAFKAAPTFRAASDNAGGVSPCAVNKPTGTAQGDCLLATMSRFSTNGTLSGPAGWTMIGSELTTSSQMWTSYWYKVAGASEPASYTWTSAGDSMNGSIYDWYNTDTTNPIDVSASSTNTGSSTVVIPSVTPTVSGGIQVGLMANLIGPYNAAPSGWIQDDTDGGQSNGEDHRTTTLTASTASGTGSQGMPQSCPWIVLAVALKPPQSGGGSVNGSSTILALAGILGGISGLGALPRGINAGPGVGRGINGNAAINSGIAGQGEVQAKSAATPSETIEGQAGVGSGLSGQGEVGASSQALDQASIKAQGAIGTGQSGTGNLGTGQSGSVGLLSGLSGFAGFISGLAGQGIIPAVAGTLGSFSNGVATILAQAGFMNGLSGISGFLGGLAGRSGVSSGLSGSGNAGGGASGSAGLSSGLSGHGNVFGSTVSLNQATVSGSGNIGGNFFGGLGDLFGTGGILRLAPFKLAFAVKSLLNLVFGTKPRLSVTFAEKPNLSLNFRESARLSAVFAEKAHLTLTFTLEPPVAKPNSTITVTATATDINGNPMSTAATVTVTVTFPDGTTQNFSLSSGVTNAGSGNYTITYTTKSPGQCLEDWLIIDPTGNQTEAHNITPVGF